MSFSEKIIRHAKLVLVIWIIATILMAPLALKLNEIVLYKETELLPEASEYKKAIDLWQELKVNYTGFSAVLAGDMIIVENMKFPEDGISWYDKFKERVLAEGIAKDVYSAYDMLNATKKSAEENVTIMYNQLYNAAKMIDDNLKSLVNNVTLLSDSLWQMYTTMKSLRKSLEVLIPAYNTTLRALEEAYNNTLMLKGALLQGSAGLEYTIKNLTMTIKALENVTMEIKQGILSLDENYTNLYSNLRELEYLERLINESIWSINSAIYNILAAYDLTVFNVIRTHFYLLKATSAYTAGITEADIEKVLYLTNCSQIAPIPSPTKDLILAVYYAVINVTYGNPQLANDTTLITIGKNLLENALLEYNYTPEELALLKTVLDEYHKAFLGAYCSTYNGNMTALLDMLIYLPGEQPPITAWKSQLAVFSAIDSLGENAIRSLSASEALVSMITLQVPPEYEDMSKELARLILNESINLGTSPKADDVINATINVTKTIVLGLGVPPLNGSVLRYLLTVGATPEIAYSIIRNSLTNDTYRMLLDIVYELDRNASGTLQDKSILKVALVNALEKLSPEDVPEDILKTLASYAVGEISEKELILISKSYATKEFTQVLKSQLMEKGLPENISEIIVLDIIENYTRYLSNESLALRQAAYYVTLVAPPLIPRSALFDAIMRIINGSSLDDAAINLVVSSLQIPSDFREIVANALRYLGPSPTEGKLQEYIISTITSSAPFKVPDFIVEDLTELYNITASKKDVLSMIIDDMRNIIPEEGRKLLDYISIYGTNITKDELNNIIKEMLVLPDSVKSAFNALGINSEEFINDIANNYTYKSVDVVNKYAEVVFNKIWSSVFNSIHGILVSNDNRSFVIVLETDSYDNIMKAYEIAEKTVPNGVKLHIFGEHVMDKELSSFGKKEASRIQLISTISVITITIIVMESFLASILPFIGIGTAITMSLASVYVLGSLGLIDVSSYSRTLLMTAPLGLGVDYATYMVRRFKIELANGTEYIKAAEIALRESFPGISASAFTDIAGFAVLALAWDFPFMRSLGLTLPIGVAYVYVSSLIVTPSILVLTKGRKWFWYPYDIDKTKERLKSIRSIVVSRLSNPKVAPVLFIAIIALGAFMGYEAFTIERSHDYTVFLPISSKSYDAYSFYASNYDIGSLIPIRVVMEFNDHWRNHVDTIKSLVSELSSVENVAHVTSVLDNESYSSRDGRIIGIEVTLSVNPLSIDGIKSVQRIREIAHSYRTENVKVYVGGEPEASKEIEDLLDSEFYGKVLPAAIILMFLTLFLTYRSLPVTAIILGSLGISVFGGLAATKWVASYMNIPIPWFLPIILVSVIIGVGIDYNSFYINRVRELMRTKSARESAEIASAEFSLFIIGLSFIVASAFLSMLVSESWGIREIGIALSVAVFLSAVLGAYLFLPVVSVLLGRKLWWPRKKF